MQVKKLSLTFALHKLEGGLITVVNILCLYVCMSSLIICVTSKFEGVGPGEGGHN